MSAEYEVILIRDLPAMCGDCFDEGWVWEGDGHDLLNSYKIPCPFCAPKDGTP